jgi:hypothetical protein
LMTYVYTQPGRVSQQGRGEAWIPKKILSFPRDF